MGVANISFPTFSIRSSDHRMMIVGARYNKMGGKIFAPCHYLYLRHVYFRWISAPAAGNPWGNLHDAIALTNGFMSLEFRLMGRRESSDSE